MIAARRRFARGPKRPRYLANPELDKFMMMLGALMIEVSAVRDRLDSHEALAERGLAPTAEALEAFRLTPERQAVREQRREAMLKRIFRVVLEELEESRESIDTRALEETLAEDGASPPRQPRCGP
jgi:hypothetical protein